MHKCRPRHPPGEEIYREQRASGTIAFFEVDGERERVCEERDLNVHSTQVYCQNLCLLGKLFIESKTAYLNVDEFFFYVLAEYTPAGYYTTAYFSKV
jgi:hypothetical protein